jgi:rare lipoprotein A (peptidoglycan hydrolase)
MQPILEVHLKVANGTVHPTAVRLAALAMTAALALVVFAGSTPAVAEAATRHKRTTVRRSHKASVRRSRRVSTRRASTKAAGSVRITRYGGKGEWQGTAGAAGIGLPSNTRDLTNAGIMFFAHKSMPFGTRVLFSHDGYQAIGICVDRGPYTSAVFDIGPILGNELRLQGSDSVTYQVIQ